MVTIASSRLPPPRSWSAFEDICRDAFGARWSNPNLSRHGRQGQPQHGVDIYGQDHAGNLVAIQCKNTSNPISSAMVAAEVANAEKFTPSITMFYLASTCDTDATLQEYVRTLSMARVSQGKFGVEIVFWPDIVQDLARKPELAAKHYPQHFPLWKVTPVDTQHDRDVRNLTQLLNVIDLPSVIEYLTWGAKYIHFSVEEHLNQILAVRHSPVFVVSDLTLLSAIDHLVAQWSELRMRMAFAQYDLLPNNMLVFHMLGDGCRSSEETNIYESIDAQLETLGHAIVAFSRHVQVHYPEIDLAITSREAGRLYT
ncbi:hypothetical protein [Xanthomonas campestris]|uniref:hypothetical protein n=1 Tax=Xanthomonas campestris TaxID=339 RepID=UPI00094AD70B|nr:hypothetical protein [Xanthomonas campestris]